MINPGQMRNRHSEMSREHRSAQSIIFFLKALKYSSDLVMGNSKLHLNPFRRSDISQYITGAKFLLFNSVTQKAVLSVHTKCTKHICICVSVYTCTNFADLYFSNTVISL